MEFNFLNGCCHYCSVALFTSFLLFLAEVVKPTTARRNCWSNLTLSCIMNVETAQQTSLSTSKKDTWPKIAFKLNHSLHDQRML